MYSLYSSSYTTVDDHYNYISNIIKDNSIIAVSNIIPYNDIYTIDNNNNYNKSITQRNKITQEFILNPTCSNTNIIDDNKDNIYNINTISDTISDTDTDTDTELIQIINSNSKRLSIEKSILNNVLVPKVIPLLNKLNVNKLNANNKKTYKMSSRRIRANQFIKNNERCIKRYFRININPGKTPSYERYLSERYTSKWKLDFGESFVFTFIIPNPIINTNKQKVIQKECISYDINDTHITIEIPTYKLSYKNNYVTVVNTRRLYLAFTSWDPIETTYGFNQYTNVEKIIIKNNHIGTCVGIHGVTKSLQSNVFWNNKRIYNITNSNEYRIFLQTIIIPYLENNTNIELNLVT